MRIVDVVGRAVSVPRLPEFRPKTAHGERRCSEYVVLQLMTDSGAVGLGEATVDRGWSGEDASSTARLLNGSVRDALLGCDPLNWAELSARVTRLVQHRPFLTAGLEMASLDLLGKQTGLPLALLLGGAHRQQIDTKFVVPARETEIALEVARRAVERGARALKIKVGVNLAQDVARVAAVRCALPAMHLTVDANEGWSVSEAPDAVRQMRELGVQAVEQPVPRDAWSAMAALRRVDGPAIAGDESIWTEHDVITAAGHGALDVLCLYPGKCGGIRAGLTVAALAAAHGMQISVGSNLELGVASAAMAHFLVTLPHLAASMPADLIGPLYHEHSLITDDSFVRFDGAVLPPGPGLGVELDEAAIAHYLVRS